MIILFYLIESYSFYSSERRENRVIERIVCHGKRVEEIILLENLLGFPK